MLPPASCLGPAWAVAHAPPRTRAPSRGELFHLACLDRYRKTGDIKLGGKMRKNLTGWACPMCVPAGDNTGAAVPRRCMHVQTGGLAGTRPDASLPPLRRGRGKGAAKAQPCLGKVGYSPSDFPVRLPIPSLHVSLPAPVIKGVCMATPMLAACALRTTRAPALISAVQNPSRYMPAGQPPELGARQEAAQGGGCSGGWSRAAGDGWEEGCVGLRPARGVAPPWGAPMVGRAPDGPSRLACLQGAPIPAHPPHS